ncbi:MAG: acetolactate decarboxylase [Streptosporangiaceae bacterium]
MTSDAHNAFRGFAKTVLSHHHGAPHSQHAAAGVYQTSTMAALLDGIYDGEVTIAELLGHGDFGLGTFNHLDGEMVVLGGVCHHLRADGSASVAAADDHTPFAAVTWFQPETTVPLPEPASRGEVQARIDEVVESANLMQAVRISGMFSRVRTRTVMAQAQPYPPLTEATADQPVTEFRDVTGTLAGFRTPDYEQGISVAGYHLHFINESRTHGGHVLDFEIRQGTATIAVSSELHLSLPRTPAFRTANLSMANIAQQIHQTEGG